MALLVNLAKVLDQETVDGLAALITLLFGGATM
jgi:hypothetical protein